MILHQYIYNIYYNKKIELFSKTFNFFFINKKKTINLLNLIKNNLLINYFLINSYNNKLLNELNNIGYNDTDLNNILNNNNKKNLNKLINICTKKGKKKIAFNIVIKALLLIKHYFFINPFNLLNLAIKKTEHMVKIQILKKKSRQKIIPRLLFLEQRRNLSLRIIVNNAKKNILNYRYLYISLANSIIYYALINLNYNTDNVIKSIHEMNESAFLNKFLMFKKKKRKKFKIIKKIKKKTLLKRS
jgi:ribosomal protein S7